MSSARSIITNKKMKSSAKYSGMFRIAQELCNNSTYVDMAEYELRITQLLEIKTLWENQTPFKIVPSCTESIDKDKTMVECNFVPKNDELDAKADNNETTEQSSDEVMKLNGLSDPFDFITARSTEINLTSIVNFTAFIIHAGNHWVTVTNTNPNCENGSNNEWVVYDSLNTESYLKHTRSFFARIKELSPEFKGSYESVEVVKQEGSNDCGLFSLAYVLAIANKKDPAKLIFNQKVMRTHYNKCVESGVFTEFESVATTPDHEPVYKRHAFRFKQVL